MVVFVVGCRVLRFLLNTWKGIYDLCLGALMNRLLCTRPRTIAVSKQRLVRCLHLLCEVVRAQQASSFEEGGIEKVSFRFPPELFVWLLFITRMQALYDISERKLKIRYRKFLAHQANVW